MDKELNRIGIAKVDIPEGAMLECDTSTYEAIFLKDMPFAIVKDNDKFILQVRGWATEKKCRVCGCTDSDCRQCVEAQGFPCHWVEDDLCSRCKNEQNNNR